MPHPPTPNLFELGKGLLRHIPSWASIEALLGQPGPSWLKIAWLENGPGWTPWMGYDYGVGVFVSVVLGPFLEVLVATIGYISKNWRGKASCEGSDDVGAFVLDAFGAFLEILVATAGRSSKN